MSLNFTCAVVTGSAGGLGKCFAQSLISKGKKVILAGRTESSLKQTASEIGAAAYYVIDVSKTGSLTGAVETILKEHPDVDCLFNNAGVQKPLNFASENITDKLGDIDEEINTNITGLVHLCALFVPHFLKNDKPAAIFNVTSGLAYIPISPVPVCLMITV
jgi:short-subunit dehydrogenase involved in D-alanine esterification of teichoic acids